MYHRVERNVSEGLADGQSTTPTEPHRVGVGSGTCCEFVIRGRLFLACHHHFRKLLSRVGASSSSCCCCESEDARITVTCPCLSPNHLLADLLTRHVLPCLRLRHHTILNLFLSFLFATNKKTKRREERKNGDAGACLNLPTTRTTTIYHLVSFMVMGMARRSSTANFNNEQVRQRSGRPAEHYTRVGRQMLWSSSNIILIRAPHVHIAHLHNSTCFPFFDSPQSTTVGAGLQLHQGTPPSNSKLLALFAGAFPSPPRRLFFIYLIPPRDTISSSPHSRCLLSLPRPVQSFQASLLAAAAPRPPRAGSIRRDEETALLASPALACAAPPCVLCA